jgi:hypothetical protein
MYNIKSIMLNNGYQGPRIALPQIGIVEVRNIGSGNIIVPFSTHQVRFDGLKLAVGKEVLPSSPAEMHEVEMGYVMSLRDSIIGKTSVYEGYHYM